MDKAVRVELPEDLAQELVQAELAVFPFTTRGDAAEIVRFIVESIDNAANVVTVVTAPQVMKQVAHRLRRFLDRRSGSKTVEIRVEGPEGVRTIKIDPASDDDADLGATLGDALDEVTTKTPD